MFSSENSKNFIITQCFWDAFVGFQNNKATEERKTRPLFSGKVAGGDSACPPQPKPGQDPICWLP